jgi:hypothetical protein
MYKNFTYDLNILSKRIQKQLINDSFALSFAGLQQINKSFELLNKIDLSNTNDFNMWNTIILNITMVYNILKRNNFIKNIKYYINKNILQHVKLLFSKIGWEDKKEEGNNFKNLRPLLIDFLIMMDDEDTKKQAFELFSQQKYKYVIKIIGKYGSIVEFDKLMHIFETQTSENPQLKDEVIEAFGHTTDEHIINKIINEVIFQKIREQDIWYLLNLLSHNKNSCTKIWYFVKNNWNNILKIYKPGSSGLSSTIKSVAQGFANETELNDYMSFFKIPPEGTKMAVDQSIEKLKNKINTINRIVNNQEFVDLLME